MSDWKWFNHEREPAPNRNSRSGVPRTDRRTPHPPSHRRQQSDPVAPNGLNMPLPPPPAYFRGSTHPLPFRVTPTSSESYALPQLPPPPTIYRRRGRHLQIYSYYRTPGPTLAGIGVDRQDTPPNLSSLDEVLNARTARPLLPTPRTGGWGEGVWTPVTAVRMERDGFGTPRGSSTRINESTTSPSLQSPFTRRNALADIRSPVTPASTEDENETHTRHNTMQDETSTMENVARPSASEAENVPEKGQQDKPKYRPSKFVEHLDINAPAHYFDQEKLDKAYDSGYDGDDEKAF